MKKRSVLLKGHSTSVTLEDDFWQALKYIAVKKNTSMRALISIVDDNRLPEDNLSSCIRLFILKWYQDVLAKEKSM